MTERFESRGRLIVVSVALVGPMGRRMLRMAVDTGASVTVISQDMLHLVGHDPSAAERRVAIATVSGMQTAPVIRVGELTALGLSRRGIAVLAHTLPPATGVEGLLGLDFFRDRRLTIDFRAGEITLE